jgi:hypothetical protein
MGREETNELKKKKEKKKRERDIIDRDRLIRLD